MKENKYRTHYCGLLREENIGDTVKLSGWIENIRDHGGVIFVDVRDEKGVIQTVTNDEALFNGLTRETVICLEGTIRKREENDYNNRLETGTIEVLVHKLEVLGKSKNILPFEVMTSTDVNEEIRLKYRYLDLRNKKVHDNIIFRSKVISYLRNKMQGLEFTEIQTPILTASSPEGARDFIVPSRKFHGKFYALPQAPQIFKQLLMVGGFDKYFQIAPCFRDEDARADRIYGEFYQLDMEMSFVTEEDIYQLGEEIFIDVFTNFSNKKISNKPFVRIPYKEAMLKYGTDKPDLRNPLVIIDLTNEFKNTTFKPFSNTIVRGIKVDGIADKSNSWFNEVADYASSIGMPGIGYITVNSDMSFKGPIDKFLSDGERKNLIDIASLKEGSVLFFIADKYNAATLAGHIRNELGRKLDLLDKNKYEFCIVNDFPMYEYSEEEGKLIFTHNPFSMPQGGLESLNNKNPLDILAYQFDFVCNGVELVSGAIRNHDIEIMKKAFEIAGYTENELKERFKALYTAFQYGAPPHGGMAIGIDRMIMMLKDEDSIREVIAFPMNASGQDVMMGSPSDVTENQLREVHIKVR
ncbi:MAG: aspartate--tRNA ligase [Clostridium sp.]|nr:aspartate--tRNA ligase [Clostridium sp.]MCM1444273.1 aspartate--tRNA ligase [Candidatus Amulumruptor caecigallinarius]